jgi:hypothetical protein
MEVSHQLHVPAALSPGKKLPVPIELVAVDLRDTLDAVENKKTPYYY